jgi:hypothetical protein
MARSVTDGDGEREEPDVILDFEFEDGMLFAAVRNICDRPAYRVSVTFDKPFTGLGGTRETSALPLFRNISFLAPRKEIRTLVDTTASYFARRQPAKLEAEVRWRDGSGRRRSHRIAHDLTIYKQLAYLTRKEPDDAGHPG